MEVCLHSFLTSELAGGEYSFEETGKTHKKVEIGGMRSQHRD